VLEAIITQRCSLAAPIDDQPDPDPVRQRTWPIEPVRLNGMTVAAYQARPHNRLFDACEGRAGDTAATWSVVLIASR
jgi:hypothetical protein